MSRRQKALALVVLAAGILGYRFIRSLHGELDAMTPSKVLLDRRGRFLAEIPGSNEAWGYWPLPASLPEKIAIATLETEDRQFYHHTGVHLPSVLRASWQNARAGRVVSGASTIAMQIARLQHPRRRSIFAKTHEAAEALLLVLRHGHETVLRHYLTIAPYGNRCHGASRAARLYFDKPLEDLSWLQAAYLAALPQQPSKMTPWTEAGHALALRRAQLILKQLRRRGVLSSDELSQALSSNLRVAPRPHRHPEAMHAVVALSRRVAQGPALTHHATIDLDLQRMAHSALNDNLRRLRPLGASNSAAVVVDSATGDVLAWVGSADYFDSVAHGAIDYLSVRRSPGSALKPFLYAMALERGTLTAASELPDTPYEIEVRQGGAWTPENITHDYLGPMLLRQALANSRNIPALRVLSEVGVDCALARLERAGIAVGESQPGLSLALGALPVTPFELATLYTALANQGRVVPLRTLLAERPVEGARLLSREAAMLTAHILADPQARRPGFPTGGALDFDCAVAIKTGTSQGYRDAWSAAFSDRLLVVTWVGNHDQRKMNGVGGANGAAPAAHAILEAMMPLRSPHLPVASEMPLPAELAQVEVCALSGRLPGAHCTHRKTEHFLRGTEPHERCPFHVEVRLDRRNGLRAGASCPREHVTTRQMLALPETYSAWARKQHLGIAPTTLSPLCPESVATERSVTIREPRHEARYLIDPDTPAELSTLRLAAVVTPANEELIWLVDDTPVAKVGYPHELRWPLQPGRHTIRARLAGSTSQSAPVTIVIDD